MILTIMFGLVAAVSALTVLTLLSKVSAIEGLFFRTLTGGSVGGFTNYYLTGVTPALSFYEACLNGDFEIGGYVVIISTFILIGVWFYNLLQYNGRAFV